MGAQVVDYRVSTLVVLCKDCGNDVGLYPARHKCTPIDRPAMPPLPTQYKKPPGSLDMDSRNTSSLSMTSSSSNESPLTPSTAKWTNASKLPVPEENDESVYFNNFAANLPEKNEPSGKKLWGKIRQNDKWKQLSEKNEKPKASGKLWGKLLQATQTMAEKMPSRDDRGAESDEDDWDGETHVARILREYYEQKHLPLPEWLFDDNMSVQRKNSTNGRNEPQDMPDVDNAPMRTPSRRRLWEPNQNENNKVSSRERERQELRQAASNNEDHRNRDRDNARDRYEERYNQDRYRHNDDYRPRDERYRDEDRYHQRDDYRQHEEDRYRQREEERYRQHEEERYRQKEEERYRQHEEERYRQKEEERYRQKEEERYRQKEEERYRQRDDRQRDDHYNKYSQDRYYEESSHTRPQQRPSSAHRQRAFEDNNYQPIRSGRSIRGYKDTSSSRYEGADMDDYYSSHSRQIPQTSQERSQRYNNEPSARSHRYDNTYF